MNNDSKLMLCKKAIKAMENAYSPYSGYKVGAALLCRSGGIYTGCNIENASYTPTVCAERCAVFSAVADGERDFEAIAIAGGAKGEITSCAYPCGVCRQVLSEFCDRDFIVITVKNADGDKIVFEEHTLSELLPYSFGSDNLNKPKGGTE